MNCDWHEVTTARIRGLQAIYADSHGALQNWGAWSRDRRGIFPTMTPPAIWSQFKRSEIDDYGEEQPEAPTTAPVKAEAAERQPYQELAALVLDERLHAPGGLPQYVRHVIRIAYVSAELPEYQFPAICGCTLDAFCERLEAALQFVGRFTGRRVA